MVSVRIPIAISGLTKCRQIARNRYRLPPGRWATTQQGLNLALLIYYGGSLGAQGGGAIAHSAMKFY